jgi:erythromycin esterase
VQRFAGLAALAVSAACASRPAGEPAAAAPAGVAIAIDASALADDAKIAWLREHGVPLRSLHPDDEDFADLEPLRAALAGVRIVALGEATHGDGTSFLARSRLVRFLHREMGYDVLAFESGLYDCWKAWQRIAAGEDAGTAFRESVFAIWSRSRQMQPLIEYFAAAARSPRPLELAGIDVQLTGAEAERHFAADLRRVAEAAGMPGADFDRRIAPVVANVVEARYELGELPEPAAREGFLVALGDLEQRLRRGDGMVDEPELWIRVVNGMRQLAPASWATDWTKPLMADTVSFPVRDRIMGEHLLWLARGRYPGRKIILWLHNAHAARNLASIDVASPEVAPLYQVWKPAGHVAHAVLGEEMYVIAMVAHHGQHQFAVRKGPPTELLPASAGSLEDLLHRAGFANAFLDLRRGGARPRWLDEPLVARPIKYEEMRARWPQVFDGVLFIDTMEPSQTVPRAAAAAPTPGGR